MPRTAPVVADVHSIGAFDKEVGHLLFFSFSRSFILENTVLLER